MCGVNEWFSELDISFKQNMKLGDDSRMNVEGRGRIRLEINGRVQVITDVYFVPGLKNNLFSVGQLQQKGLRFVIEENVCEVWHKQHEKMIMNTTMTKNRMFVIVAKIRKKKEEKDEACFQVVVKSEDLWHKRLGHLNFKSLKALAQKEMVIGLPKLS